MAKKLALPDSADPGETALPTIEGLNRQQSLFVYYYVQCNGNGAEAARRAGYSDHLSNARVKAYLNLRNEKILKAIRDESQKVLESSVAMATEVLLSLAKDEKTPASVRLQAAQALLDRGGLQLVSRSKVEHQHTIEHKTDAELLEGIKRLSRELGMKDVTPALPAIDMVPVEIK